MMGLSFLQTDELVERYHRENYFPDASYAIFSAKGTLHQGTCGSATKDTWFDLASLTKLYTTTAVLYLIQQGRLRLQDSVAVCLPAVKEYQDLSGYLEPITIEQLLTHRSGLLPWYPFYTQEKEFFVALKELLVYKPKLDGMNYSDLNFLLLGKIVEQYEGISLPEAFREMGLSCLAEPAYFPPGSALREKLLKEGRIAISCYGNVVEEKMCADRGLNYHNFRDPSLPVIGQANDGNCWYYFSGVSGHAGLFAPAYALIKLGQFYLTSQEPLFRRAMEDTGLGRGLGFEVDSKYPMGCGHTGFTGTSLWLSPQNGVGAVMLTNRLAYENGQLPKDLSVFRTEFHTSILKDLGMIGDCETI